MARKIRGNETNGSVFNDYSVNNFKTVQDGMKIVKSLKDITKLTVNKIDIDDRNLCSDGNICRIIMSYYDLDTLLDYYLNKKLDYIGITGDYSGANVTIGIYMDSRKIRISSRKKNENLINELSEELEGLRV